MKNLCVLGVLVATLAGTFVNFFINKYWTFRHLN